MLSSSGAPDQDSDFVQAVVVGLVCYCQWNHPSPFWWKAKPSVLHLGCQEPSYLAFSMPFFPFWIVEAMLGC